MNCKSLQERPVSHLSRAPTHQNFRDSKSGKAAWVSSQEYSSGSHTPNSIPHKWTKDVHLISEPQKNLGILWTELLYMQGISSLGSLSENMESLFHSLHCQGHSLRVYKAVFIVSSEYKMIFLESRNSILCKYANSISAALSKKSFSHSF
jgi:hypothetical protein